jgi:hypothetical protein
MSYSYRKILPNGKTTGQAFIETLAIACGPDYNVWKKHPNFLTTLKYSHQVIFDEPISTFKSNGALRLRINFLTEAGKQSKSTKSKRLCYRDVTVDALAAGVIDVDTYHKLIK